MKSVQSVMQKFIVTILRHGPRFAVVKECFEVAFTHTLFCRADLVGHQVFVTGVSDTAKDTDGIRQVQCVAHPCEEVRQGGVFGILVVNDEILSGVFAVGRFRPLRGGNRSAGYPYRVLYRRREAHRVPEPPCCQPSFPCLCIERRLCR